MARIGGERRRRAAEGGKRDSSVDSPRARSPPRTAHVASSTTRTPGTMLARITVLTSAPRGRTKGADPRADMTHPALQSERAPPDLARRGVGDQRIARRRAQALAEPVDDAQTDHLPSGRPARHD